MAVIIGEHDSLYFREDACWLNGYYIWGFKGPVILVLAGNIVVLAKGLYTAWKVLTNDNYILPIP